MTAIDFDSKLLQADPTGALAALAEAGDGAERLVEAWIKAGNAGAVSETAEAASGAARKAARRGLNVLRARGVAVPDRARVSALAGAKAAPQLEALMLAPDSMGNVLLVISQKSQTSRAKVAFVYLNDALGVHRIDVGDLSQTQMKDALSRAYPGAAFKPVSVPLDWARARIAEARKRHAERGLPEPLGFVTATALLTPLPTAAVAHPFDSEGLELSTEDAAEMVKSSAALHALPEFRGWFPHREAVDELFAAVGAGLAAAGQAPEAEPDSALLRETLDSAVAASTDRYFTPERRVTLVASLKDAALSVLSRDGEARALEISGLMKVIAEAGLITNPPRDVPFLRAYFEKAISLMAIQNGGQLRIPMPRPASDEAAAV